MALAYTADPNRSTDINFVHVNGRSLYIADWRMVMMEGRNVLYHVKGRGIVLRERKCPGGICPGEMSGALPASTVDG